MEGDVSESESESDANVTDPALRIGRPSRLGEMLIGKGLVTADDVQEALAEQAAGSEWRLGRLLVRQGAIDDLTLTQAIASQFHVPVVELRDSPPRPAALALLPREAAYQLQALPLLVEGNQMTVAVADPPTRELRVAIERSTGVSVRLVMCPADELAAALEYWYSDDYDIDMVPLGNPFAAQAMPESVIDPAGVEETDQRIDCQIVDWLLGETERQGATAVHLDHGEDGLRIRYRVGQTLNSGPQLPSAAGADVVRKLLAAAGLDPVDNGIHEGQFDAVVESRPLTCRVAAASTATGTHVVIRTRPRSGAGRRFEDIGITGPDAMALRKILDNRRGVVVAAAVEASARESVTRTIVDQLGSEDHAIVLIGSLAGIQVSAGIGLAVGSSDPDANVTTIHRPRR